MTTTRDLQTANRIYERAFVPGRHDNGQLNASELKRLQDMRNADYFRPEYKKFREGAQFGLSQTASNLEDALRTHFAQPRQESEVTFAIRPTRKDDVQIALRSGANADPSFGPLVTTYGRENTYDRGFAVSGTGRMVQRAGASPDHNESSDRVFDGNEHHPLSYFDSNTATPELPPSHWQVPATSATLAESRNMPHYSSVHDASAEAFHNLAPYKSRQANAAFSQHFKASGMTIS